jgi:hypothetical protein
MVVPLLLMLTMASCAAGLRLDADAPWLLSTYDYRSDNTALLTTLRDLEKDWAAVLGFRPALLTQLPPSPVAGNASATRVSAVLMGLADGSSRHFLQPLLPYAPPGCLALPAREAHCLYTAPDPYFGGVAIVVLG